MTIIKTKNYLKYLIISVVVIIYLATVYFYSNFAYANQARYQNKLMASATEKNDEFLINEIRGLLTRGELVEANNLLMSSQVNKNIANKKEQIQKAKEAEQKAADEKRHAEELAKQEAEAKAAAQKKIAVRTTAPKPIAKTGTCSKNELYVVVSIAENTENIWKGDPDCRTGEIIETRSVSTGRQENCYNSQTGETYWCGTPQSKWVIRDKRSSSGEFGPYFLPIRDLKGNWGPFYGLHGTNEEYKIGSYASAGCVRHYNQDIIHLYNLLPEGTIVWTE